MLLYQAEMYIIYSPSGFPIGILNEDGIQHTTIIETLCNSGYYIDRVRCLGGDED